METLWEELGFVGVDKLYRAAKRRGLQKEGRSWRLQDVKEWLSRQSTAQVARRQSPAKGHIVAFKKRERYGCDLISFALNPKIMKENSEYPVILVVVDYFSRFVAARPARSKQAADILKEFQAVVQRWGKPEICQTDGGLEFSGVFHAWCEQEGISHMVTDAGDHRANSISDGAVTQVESRLFKTMQKRRTREWLDRLYLVVRGYNNSAHSALMGATPRDIWEGDSKALDIERVKTETRKALQTQAANRSNRIVVGDSVRVIERSDNRLRRAYRPRQSGEVFIIQSIDAGRQYATMTSGDRFPFRFLQEVPPGSLSVPLTTA